LKFLHKKIMFYWYNKFLLNNSYDEINSIFTFRKCF
jgi:hypothetical protein